MRVARSVADRNFRPPKKSRQYLTARGLLVNVDQPVEHLYEFGIDIHVITAA